jgi:DNA-binding GntR family transcriptional regulator
MKVSQRIANAIEAQIRDGSLLPGDPIDEVKFMETFGVSRTPVREALLRLQAQGLVDSLPRGGAVVAKMDVQQLLSMWELLAELESLCARYACERMTPEERQELENSHLGARSIVDAEDEEGWQQANLDFHEILYRGSRNLYLRQQLLLMRTRTGAYRRHAFGAVGRIQTSYSHHEEILRSILAHDSAAAARAMFHHMSPGHAAGGLRSSS